MKLSNSHSIRSLVLFVVLALSVSVSVQIVNGNDTTSVHRRVVRHTWGEDLSGSLQGAGGIGGLLRTKATTPESNEARNTEHEHTLHYDSNGNVILLTDAQANESARYAYDAFGRTLTASGPAAKTKRYRFSTKPVEEESGLCYYGYRYYDPITGRWPSRDPIAEKGGFNLYGMINNNALSKLDHLGLNELPPLQSGWCRFWLNCTLDSSVAAPASTGGSSGPIATCGSNACWYRCTRVGLECNSTDPGNPNAGGVIGSSTDQLACFWNVTDAPSSCPATKEVYYGFHETTPQNLAHNCYVLQ